MIAVTDRHLFDRAKDPEAAVNAFLRALLLLTPPPRFIVLREKDLREQEYLDLADKFLSFPNPGKVPIVLHHFAGAAKTLSVPRIHLSLNRLEELASADPAFSDFFSTIGCSVHKKEEAVRAEALGATYLFAGNVFETSCKEGLAGRGLPWLREIVSAVRIPVYAIGGVTEENLPEILSSGAADGCMRSGFLRTVFGSGPWFPPHQLSEG